MAMSRRACPSPMGEEMYSARLGRRAARTQRAGVAGGRSVRTNSSMRPFTSTGSRPCDPWPPPATVTRRPPVSPASATPAA